MRGIANTRARIQQVALELFNEKGYTETSLREIAERLGVTKAALYYHFKTKEDIVTSLVESRIEAVRELIDWTEGQPMTLQTRREIVRRYAENLYTQRHGQVMRFFERNQAALRGQPTMERYRDLMMRLISLVAPAKAPFADRLRNTLAILTLHAGLMLPLNGEISEDQRRDDSLRVALDLLTSD